MSLLKNLAARALRKELPLVTGVVTGIYSVLFQFQSELERAMYHGQAVNREAKYWSARNHNFSVQASPWLGNKGVDGRWLVVSVECKDPMVLSLTLEALRKEHHQLLANEIVVDSPNHFHCVIHAASHTLYAHYHAALAAEAVMTR